ncbi:hypothetical protein KFE25_002675 [Diacronema lutheri]|uniref:Uncharacterized protein n=2 Tax=Diacronema lutheri TaxID=2081491 RepID=A0A8J6CF83_DIALT|nr:hypothetical protein KFE25_002675 [Diacronema lutheri]
MGGRAIVVLALLARSADALGRPSVQRRAAPRAQLHASLDLTCGADLAVFCLWGSPVPAAISVLLAARERARGDGGGATAAAPSAARDAMDGAGRNMLWAFPSFGLLLREPCEPAGMPRWQRAVLLLNTWAAIAWYLRYKWLIEDELRERTGDGLGGAAVVTPFALGLAAGVAGELLGSSLERSLVGELDSFSAAFWAGFAWIYVCQFWLYTRVNRLYTERGDAPPLSAWGLLLPGYNLLTGVRQVHFLAAFEAEARRVEPPDDPFCAAFPFATKPELGFVELLTQPAVWYDWDERASRS